MDYRYFERTVKELVAGCGLTDRCAQLLPMVDAGKRQLFIQALQSGFSCEQIADMLEQGILRAEQFSAILHQKMNDNTSEIQA